MFDAAKIIDFRMFHVRAFTIFDCDAVKNVISSARTFHVLGQQNLQFCLRRKFSQKSTIFESFEFSNGTPKIIIIPIFIAHKVHTKQDIPHIPGLNIDQNILMIIMERTRKN